MEESVERTPDENDNKERVEQDGRDIPKQREKSVSPETAPTPIKQSLAPAAETQEDEENNEEIYEVHSIKTHRIKDGKYEFSVTWLGYPASDTTWEPMENLLDAREYFESYLKAKNLQLGEDPKTRKFSIEKRPNSGTKHQKKSPTGSKKNSSSKKGAKASDDKASNDSCGKTQSGSLAKKEAKSSDKKPSESTKRSSLTDAAKARRDSSAEKLDSAAKESKNHSDRESSVEIRKVKKSPVKVREQPKRTGPKPRRPSSPAPRKQLAKTSQHHSKATSRNKGPDSEFPVKLSERSHPPKRRSRSSSEDLQWGSPTRRKRREEAAKKRQRFSGTRGGTPSPNKTVTKPFKENYDSSPEKNHQKQRERRGTFESDEKTARSSRGSKTMEQKTDKRRSRSKSKSPIQFFSTSETGTKKESDSEGEFAEYALEDPKRMGRKTGFQMGWIPEKIVGVTKVSLPLVYLVNWKNSKIVEPVRSLVLSEKAPELLIEFLEMNMTAKSGAVKRGTEASRT